MSAEYLNRRSGERRVEWDRREVPIRSSGRRAGERRAGDRRRLERRLRQWTSWVVAGGAFREPGMPDAERRIAERRHDERRVAERRGDERRAWHRRSGPRRAS